MNKTTRYSPEIREREVLIVTERQADYDSQWAATGSITAKTGCTPEMLRKWLHQANVLELQRAQIDLERQHAWIHADQAKARRELAMPLNNQGTAVRPVNGQGLTTFVAMTCDTTWPAGMCKPAPVCEH